MPLSFFSPANDHAKSLGRGVVHRLRGRARSRAARGAVRRLREVDRAAEPVAPAVHRRAVGDAGAQRRQVRRRASARSTRLSAAATTSRGWAPTSITASPITLTSRTGGSIDLAGQLGEPRGDAGRAPPPASVSPSSVKPTRSANATACGRASPRPDRRSSKVTASLLRASAGSAAGTRAASHCAGERAASPRRTAAKRAPASRSSSPGLEHELGAERAQRVRVARHPAPEHAVGLQHLLGVEAGVAHPRAASARPRGPPRRTRVSSGSGTASPSARRGGLEERRGPSRSARATSRAE